MNTEVTDRQSIVRGLANRWAWLAGAGAIALGCVGCAGTLDDGYKPRPLNASSSQRRAFYAPAFTPEAEQAGPDQPVGPSQHRPGSY